MTDNAIAMKVWLVQPLGDRADVYFSTPHHTRIVAQLDASVGASVGETIPIYVDLDRVHFFEGGANGRTLVSKPA